MDNNLGLKSRDILEKKFTANVKGYDPDEVDHFLDQVLADYHAMEKIIKDQMPLLFKEIESLRELKRAHEELMLRYQNLEKKVLVLDKSQYTAMAKLDLLIRIDRLEKELYKAGRDPSKIK